MKIYKEILVNESNLIGNSRECVLVNVLRKNAKEEVKYQGILISLDKWHIKLGLLWQS